jgi:L-rhamnose-H+ transport protein
MGSLFNLGLQAAKPIEEAALSIGINPILAGVPSIMLISIGGFMTNVAYCFERKWWKKSKIIPLKQTINNVLLALLSGGLWYLQFFALVISITFLAKDTVMGALSWSMLMMLNIAYGSIYSIMRKKWKGVSASTIVLLFIGITIVIFSTIVPKFF